MNKRTELYMVTLWNKSKIVVSIKTEDYDHLSIGDKKRKIVSDLNEKFQADGFVLFVKFYGYADVEVKDQYLKHKQS